MNCNQPKIIDIQGHRGCRGLMPENTIPAFEKAIALGVHTLELDVAVSKDSVVVVSHEPFMNRVICLDAEGKEIPESDDKKYNLYQMTFDSIKQFDCGTKFHPRFPEQEKLKAYKPSLEEVIKTSKILNHNIKFNIEIKASPEYDNVYTPNPKNFVQLVLEAIKNNNAFADTNLQSFDLRIMEEIKKQAPNMEVALLVDEDEDIWSKITMMSYSPEIISPYYKLLNKETIKKLKAENFKVIPWTINSVEELQKMIDFEVNGIITDYPNKLIEILEN
ncbi:glycerophosphodiester phosphodiesterase family protein [Flavivirga abyssicola]|uniref:glycerophosphodiester phosphodiesterase family protein n=1 Tax=Flavivirga abyssicola TaxID=3063533 RepID=UPI0026DEC860|nr:glycerophosphodiester phosphodiesterase family protein [Flavivirga sp. MEBiC07777]WVK12059.1 glycerophosphodiester phosphodiesterase family protein [Flavivirga sp. MEBiC07777]